MDVLGLIEISAYKTDFFRRTKEKMGNKVTEDRPKEKSCFIRFLEKPFVSGIIASLIASAIWTAVQAVFVIPQSVMKTVESDNYVNKVKTAILSSDNTNNGNNTNTVKVTLVIIIIVVLIKTTIHQISYLMYMVV
jgi:hypothetical protein